MTSWVWLNGKFRTKPWTQTMSKASESPPDQIENEVLWLIQEIGLRFLNTHLCGLSGSLLCPSFSKAELFALPGQGIS